MEAKWIAEIERWTSFERWKLPTCRYPPRPAMRTCVHTALLNRRIKELHPSFFGFRFTPPSGTHFSRRPCIAGQSSFLGESSRTWAPPSLRAPVCTLFTELLDAGVQNNSTLRLSGPWIYRPLSLSSKATPICRDAWCPTCVPSQRRHEMYRNMAQWDSLEDERPPRPPVLVHLFVL
jgi:hypothetical protein